MPTKSSWIVISVSIKHKIHQAKNNLHCTMDISGFLKNKCLYRYSSLFTYDISNCSYRPQAIHNTSTPLIFVITFIGLESNIYIHLNIFSVFHIGKPVPKLFVPFPSRKYVNISPFPFTGMNPLHERLNPFGFRICSVSCVTCQK